jgi:hypothetical protein
MSIESERNSKLVQENCDLRIALAKKDQEIAKLKANLSKIGNFARELTEDKAHAAKTPSM